MYRVGVFRSINFDETYDIEAPNEATAIALAIQQFNENTEMSAGDESYGHEEIVKVWNPNEYKEAVLLGY